MYIITDYLVGQARVEPVADLPASGRVLEQQQQQGQALAQRQQQARHRQDGQYPGAGLAASARGLTSACTRITDAS